MIIIIVFFMFSKLLISEDTNNFEWKNELSFSVSGYYKDEKIYLKEKLEFKKSKNYFGENIISIDYTHDFSKEYKNFSFNLSNSYLNELRDDLYYTLNNDFKYKRDFILQTEDLLEIHSEIKIAKYINDNFFLNIYFEGFYMNFTNLIYDENIYLKPKIQFRFPIYRIDFNLNSGFRYFINLNRKDNDFEISLKKEISNLSLTLGNYYINTNNNESFPQIDLPYNETTNNSYFDLSLKLIDNENTFLNIYSKGEFIYHSEIYENEIYLGFDLKKNFNKNIIEFLVEYGYNYNDIYAFINFKKIF